MRLCAPVAAPFLLTDPVIGRKQRNLEVYRDGWKVRETLPRLTLPSLPKSFKTLDFAFHLMKKVSCAPMAEAGVPRYFDRK